MIPRQPIKSRFEKSVAVSALLTFSKGDRLNMFVVLIAQISLGILDFAGIILIGVMGSIAISGISSSEIGNRVGTFLQFFGLSEQTLQVQIAVVGIFSALFLIAKTIVSLLVTNRVFTFLSNKGAQFASRLIDKLLASSLKQVQEKSVQELVYTATGGVNALMTGVLGGWFNLIGDFALLLILGLGLVLIDSTVALFMTTFFVLVAALIYKRLGKQFGSLGRKQADLSIQTAQNINEIVLSFRENFVRDRGGYYSRKFQNIEYQKAKGNSRINLVSMYTKYIFEIVFVLTALSISAYVFLTEPVTRAAALLSIFLATSMRVIPAVVRIQQGISRIKLQTGYAEAAIQLMKSMDKSPGTTPSVDSIPVQHVGFSPSIEINKMKFSFGSLEWALFIDEISVKPGEFIAFVGSSGAGKTTLVDLALGLRKPNEGTILISGLEPGEAIRKWPGAIAYVPQDSAILEGSILDNLALGYSKESIDESSAWEALETSHLDGFIKNLPDGLQTIVGDRGTRLSGGQRQRLGIARAFITKPSLIFLDEATSSLDGEIEAAISETMLEMRGKITVVMIAHRLSTVVSADRIYFLKEGKVAGVGTFQELKEKNTDFARQADIMGL
jgi:ABC-type multidrug transport system fused ATPase/permease subunit